MTVTDWYGNVTACDDKYHEVLIQTLQKIDAHLATLQVLISHLKSKDSCNLCTYILSRTQVQEGVFPGGAPGTGPRLKCVGVGVMVYMHPALFLLDFFFRCAVGA